MLAKQLMFEDSGSMQIPGIMVAIGFAVLFYQALVICQPIHYAVKEN